MTYDRTELKARLRREEGEVLHAYQDSEGWWTIGVGHLIDARKGGGISELISGALLDEDLNNVDTQLDAALPWWRSLDPVRQSVLADMAFNMGVPTLLTFNITLAAIQDGDWVHAAAGMRASLWARQVGARADALAAAMESGILPT